MPLSSTWYISGAGKQTSLSTIPNVPIEETWMALWEPFNLAWQSAFALTDQTRTLAVVSSRNTILYLCKKPKAAAIWAVIRNITKRGRGVDFLIMSSRVPKGASSKTRPASQRHELFNTPTNCTRQGCALSNIFTSVRKAHDSSTENFEYFLTIMLLLS